MAPTDWERMTLERLAADDPVRGPGGVEARLGASSPWGRVHYGWLPEDLAAVVWGEGVPTVVVSNDRDATRPWGRAPRPADARWLAHESVPVTGLGLRLGERTGVVDQPRMRRWVDLPNRFTRRGRTVRAAVPGAGWTMRLERFGVAVVRRAGVPIAEARGGLARELRFAPGVTPDDVALVTCLGVSCSGVLSMLSDLA